MEEGRAEEAGVGHGEGARNAREEEEVGLERDAFDRGEALDGRLRSS